MFNRLGNLGNIYNFVVSRDAVENKSFKGIGEMLKHLRRVGSSSRECLEISFDGYNHIVDEVFEIDDIRKYVKILLQQYPHLLYYVGNKIESMQILLTCYGDIETFYVGEKKPIIEYPLEDIASGSLPKQQIKLTISEKRLDFWKKAIRKEGVRNKDVAGANKSIELLESILSFRTP